MKFCTIVALIAFSIFSSHATAQEAPKKTYQEVLKEYMEKPYTGETLNAINGVGSPDEYKVKDDDGQEVRLKKQIINAIYLELESKQKRFESGQESVFFLLRAYRQLHQARELLYANDQDQLTRIAKDMIQNAKTLEANCRLTYESGVGRPDDWAEALAYRLQCELRLLQLENEAK